MIKSNSFSQKDIGQISTYQSGVAQATAHRITTRIVSDYLLQYGLTSMQWFIIGHIYDAGEAGLRLTDLSRLLGTSLPYTTNMINLLESKDIVLKKSHGSDNRTKLVSITPLYYPQVMEIETGLRNQMRNQLYHEDDITHEELQNYINVLYKIAASEQT